MTESIDSQDARRKECEVLLRATMSPSDELEKIITALQQTTSLREAQQLYLQVHALPSPELERLQTVINVYELAGERATIVQDLFHDLEEPWSLAGIAETAYSRIPSPEGASLRQALFQEEPTAVVLGLLSRHEFSIPSAIENELENVLREAFIKHQFNIFTTPVHVLIWRDSEADRNEETDKLLAEAQRTLATIRRLSLVVDYPEDIAILLQLGFSSAAAIAACPLEQFTASVPSGIQGSLTQIHAHATLIESRNEHLWAQLRTAPGGPVSTLDSMQMAAAGVGVAAYEGLAAADDASQMKEMREMGGMGHVQLKSIQATVTNTEMTKRTELQPLYAQVAAAADVLVDMDNVACEDCCSLLSSPAYFVDLLRLLKNCWIDPKKLAAGPSVLDRLLGRRPDLQHLQLSCANTKIEIPYIDVSNELMESMVEFLEDSNISSYGTYNCRDSDTAAALAAEPLNVKWPVYDKYIGKLMTPMTALPFHLRTEVVRHLLAAVGTSRQELLAIMQSPHRYDRSVAAKHTVYLERTVAAEVLGLSEKSFLAITGELLSPPDDTRPLQPPTPAEYWGYTSSEQGILGEKLALIQEELLPRAGIAFLDLVVILNVPWLKGALLVQNPETATDFTKLQKLRLYDPEGKPGAIGTFHKLGTFIRLLVRLGWSAADLDQALTVCRPGYQGTITADMLVQLSAIKRLVDLCQWPISELLRLWQDHNESKLCQILGVPAARAYHLPLVNKEKLRDPVKTLEFITQWNDLIGQGWSVDELLGLSSTVAEHLSDTKVSAFVSQLASDMIYQDIARENPSEPASDQPATSLLPQMFLIEQLKGVADNIDTRTLELLLETLSPLVDRLRVKLHSILKEKIIASKDKTIPLEFLHLVGEIHQTLSRALQLVSHAGMEPELLERLQQSSSLKLDFSNWSLENVHSVMALAESRMNRPAFELVLWAAKSKKDIAREELVNQVAKFLGVSISRAEALLRLNYPGADQDSLLKLFADPTGIESRRLIRQVGWTSRYGLHGVETSLLFDMATPAGASAEQTPIDEVLSSLAGRQASLESMHNELRERRRDALIQYLLQHPSIKAQNVRDADSLFEYLLLDVQMGAAMRTNRMSQAIATVQLFVQRCLLGLEPGILASVIPTDRWAWMQQYRLWEANRKVFLYPENWVDPSLRDNKTPAFQDFEREMMQSELSEESVTDLVKKYIYQAHETAQLHIQSYHWDRQRSSYTIHVIGRTRTSPYTFFYRRMDGLVVDTKVTPTWSPWEKLNLDIPTHVTDESGQALSEAGAYVVPVMMSKQLHLFIAHITSKTRPMGDTSSVAPIEGTHYPQPGAKPQGYWEIKLGLTVQRGRQWSPVSISHTSLDVNTLEVDGGQLPSINSFRFWTHKEVMAQRVANEEKPGKTKQIESTRLTLHVDRCVKKGDGTVSVPVGSFQLRGQEILAHPPSPSTSLNHKDTTATVFGRVIPDIGYPINFDVESWRTKWGVTLHKEMEAVMLAEMPGVSLTKMPDVALRTIEWTTSLESYSQSTALVLDMAQEDAQTAQTWFAVPQSMSKGSVSPPCLLVFDDMASIYMKMRDRDVVSPSLAPAVFGSFQGSAYKESATPAAIYNWELGFHMISLLMERLMAVQKFDLALRVARQIFDPRMAREQQQLPGGDQTTVCWRFAPFREPDVRNAGSLSAILSKAQASSGAEDAMTVPVLEWRRNPFNAHSVARNRPLVYMKRAAMKYIEILIAAGDHHFRHFTAESIPLAIQRYVEAAHIFGPAPVTIPKTVKPVVQSYSQLSATVDDLSNAHVDLEVLLPFYIPPHARSTLPSSPSTSSQTLVGIVPSSYFCVAINPEIVKLRSTIDDRLLKIRHSLDIDGQPRTPPSSGPVIDPRQAGRQMLARSGTSTVSPSVEDGPMPNYRFMGLLQRALDLAQELKTSSATYLSIKERRDGEALAVLNASHECTVQGLMLKIKESQLEEAEKTLIQLQETRRSPLMRLDYFSNLTGDDPMAPTATQDFTLIDQLYVPLSKTTIKSGQVEISRLNVLEATEIERAMEAGVANLVASGADVMASTLAMLPGLSTQVAPWGIGVNVSNPPWGQHFSLVASGARFASQMLSEDSQQASRVNRLHMQLQDRRLQANLAGLELRGIQKQIETHQHRIDAVKNELKLQELQIKHTADVKDYLMSKWTNDQLYSWLDNSLRDHLYHTYILALQMARQAERALQFETGYQSSRSAIVPSSGVWDSTHDGLLAGEGLYRALKHLEREYIHHRPSSLEIVKNISLRQVDPLALLRVREEGLASFSLPEELFDLDYPGHYHRRIQSVAVTIPCIVGPYSSVNCTLTLTSHRYRVDPTVNLQGSDYASKGLDDARFHEDKIPITAIAVSHGQQDPGVATLDFHGERYMPMEGAGAISSWTIALPSKYRSFDYRTISDIVLQIRYTARDAGQQLANAATKQLAKYFDAAAAVSAAAGLYTTLDIQNDFSNAWYAFKRPPSGVQILPRSIPLQNLSNMIPFYARHNGASTVREIFVFIGWESTDLGALSRLQVRFHDQVLSSPSKEVDPHLPGLTCFHGVKLSVSMSSSPALTFDLIRTTTDPHTHKDITLTEDEEVVESKKIGAMIERMARVFVLFRYQMMGDRK
ncbi:hypothetical protein N7462_006295 [Penicillium macrosclerotiorum]|uniref:uncharacterized protein n=1 Tax=Penicillium macrosclerotiorum TaxID=303699 RepID=UPI00254693F8|nr:uncharacterized protein N7462_006295 [Penicillium macrosclerotiorum]KAJ5683130.1 hypothetical protein N7462_006295 [Penicillium macrosclerotiorum]